ncbi:unnamed protein product [Tilletia controversa]|uniref:Thiol methyltransferase 1 n=3 Tax=Tilletia TaxID=13289 RepID=A0A8X7SV47_9BASI|nr:hypothetical protein CF328_g7683 [Tilletia controversa]KAE8188255.1 hypothetical protein CF336_g6231 [Tilletia laevis]KAE8255532.1 hypothetical protein A4X03_0g5547 [Tilletia caries]KAE8191425.1 hypothetical protein CF335_g6093 [Tilletia laevis]KAE8243024.1 hypothetical protein A4X06_0g6603 [Tilletia controversa]
MAPVDRVRAFLAPNGDSGANQGWNDAWKEELTPWDSGEPQPALLSILEEADSLVPKKGQALIAGCGRGYDPLVFAERGMDALGIDISEEAVQQANKWLESQANWPARNRVRFEVRDFFTLDLACDLAYDYTFFCALPPSWRTRWAETYARIIRPGGILIAVVYPIRPDAGPEGPPFKLAPESYKELLSDAFELQWEGVPARQKDTHVGVEQVQIWSRKSGGEH